MSIHFKKVWFIHCKKYYSNNNSIKFPHFCMKSAELKITFFTQIVDKTRRGLETNVCFYLCKYLSLILHLADTLCLLALTLF